MNTRDLTTYTLARLADCASPDRADIYGRVPAPESADPSPGAVFLRNVADSWQEAYNEEGTAPDDDRIHEIADAAPSVYTYTRWQEFTDLGAWQFSGDVAADYGPAEDMTKGAAMCLYVIARDLCYALNTEAGER